MTRSISSNPTLRPDQFIVELSKVQRQWNARMLALHPPTTGNASARSRTPICSTWRTLSKSATSRRRCCATEWNASQLSGNVRTEWTRASTEALAPIRRSSPSNRPAAAQTYLREKRVRLTMPESTCPLGQPEMPPTVPAGRRSEVWFNTRRKGAPVQAAQEHRFVHLDVPTHQRADGTVVCRALRAVTSAVDAHRRIGWVLLQSTQRGRNGCTGPGGAVAGASGRALEGRQAALLIDARFIAEQTAFASNAMRTSCA